MATFLSATGAALAATPAAPATDRDVALRADVSSLGRLLGQVLVEQGGEALFAAEERLRGLARALRDEGGGADATRRIEDELALVVDRLDGRELIGVIRAFSIFFQLVNAAEQHHRVRRRRWRDAEREEAHRAQPQSLAAAFAAFAARSVPPERIASVLDRLAVELVVTSHPTEVSRRTVLAKHMLVAQSLDTLDNTSLSPRERREAVERLLEELTILWQSDEMRSARPRVIDEVRRVLFFFEEVLFDSVGAVHEELDRVLELHYPSLRSPETLVRFGSWAGGDQDGNPDATPELVGEALGLHRDLAVRMLRQRVRATAAGLGISSRMADISPDLVASIAADETAMPAAAATIPRSNLAEPYRRKLSLVWERLDPAGERPYRDPSELVADLEVIGRSLEAHGGERIARRRIARLARQARTFGFHLARLDLRLHSERLQRAASEWTGAPAERFLVLPEDERAGMLERLLEADDAPRRPMAPNPASLEVTRSFTELRRAMAEHGPQAAGTVIVSFARRPSDILAAQLLARAAGLVRGGRGDPSQSDVDLVPLFETIEDLRRAPETLRGLLRSPVYRRHLEARGDRQTVMVGYSDSNKDGGYLAANWELLLAQERLVDACRLDHVALTLFHGRGGTASRGGGSTYTAVMGGPTGSLDGRIRITEQGEAIFAKYGLPAIAERNLDSLLSAVIERTLEEDEAPGVSGRKRVWDEALGELAATSAARYRGLVHDDPDFIPYFLHASPIRELEMLNIGSRPSRRASGEEVLSVDRLRAIPWVFAWMQNGHLLPSWYGVGAALSGFIARYRGGLGVLREMYAEWPWWRAVVDNCHMTVAKADMRIAARYASLVPDERVRERVFGLAREEYASACGGLLATVDARSLLGDKPFLQRSLQLRKPYIDPLHFIQVRLLAGLRGAAGAEERARLEHPLLLTISGIAAGLRNTG